uniref:Uncharacterized protein n=1 Tax=Oryza meridionalis TaxID=40149 RepID=A0A0E0CUW9_9ORYZ
MDHRSRSGAGVLLLPPASSPVRGRITSLGKDEQRPSSGLTATGVKIDELFIGDIQTQHKSGKTTVDVKIDSESRVSTTVTVDEALTGLKSSFSFRVPDQKSGKLDLQYLHDCFALNSTIGLTSTPLIELAATIGTNELSAGAEVGFDSTSASVTKYNSGICYNKHDFSAAVLLADKGETLKASYIHTFNETNGATVAAEVTHKLKTKENYFTIGSSHAIDSSTLLKTRFSNGGKVGVLCQHEWRPKSTVSISAEYDPKVTANSLQGGGMGVAVTMASYAAVLRPRASSTRTPRGPRRPAGAAPRRAALPATTRSPPAVAATPPPRERKQQQQPGDGQTTTATTRLYSLAPCPLLLAALLPGAEPVRAVFEPFVELVKTWGLPGWLVHWGHPGNMAVVLFAMGGYGTYLGFRIKLSDDPEEMAKAKDLHPKLLAGMFFFFAAGATGGVTALLTSDKPIFESPHAVTGIIGLALLTIQSILPTLFEGNPSLRNAHGLLGSGIMTLFLIHAAFGLQLGLSF